MSNIIIPSLGNPFNLGMLYDAHSEKIIAAKTLWDSKVLDSTKKVTLQPSSSFEIYAENTLSEKAKSLNVEGSLKLSLLGGMVEINGAAKYLDDDKSSERQARVTLKYSSTSRFEQLTMEQISGIQFTKVLDDKTATHVVTGITYGTDAFFIFDRSLTETEKIKKISGNMEVIIKSIALSGSASLDTKCRDVEEANKFHCKFYGDLQLPSNPSTFQDAVKVYQELPQLINGKNGDASVPKVIHLQPLSDFDGGHLRIVRSISDDMVSQVEQILQYCTTMTVRANDLTKNEICSNFVDLESQIKGFQMLINRFKIKFMKKLASILPKIRGQGAEEEDLANLISSVHASPFNFKDLEKYIKGKSKEMKQLSQYLKNMQKVPKINLLLPSRDGDLMTLTSDDEIEHVFCFAFNVISDSTTYMEALENYLATDQAKSVKAKEWFDIAAIASDLRSKSLDFVDFVRTNSDVEGFSFAVTDLNEESDASGPAIILYKDGSPEEYELPGKPVNLKATPIGYNSVKLEWDKPEVGADAIVSYRVYYCIDREDNPEIVREYTSTSTSQTSCRINSLTSGTTYKFWVQGVCDIGALSVESDSCIGKTNEKPRPADLILPQCTLIEKGTPNIYKLPLRLVDHDKDAGLFKYRIGSIPKTANPIPEKVMMVVGATGAGKSTMLNGLANYIMGVKFSDSFRFKVVVDEASKSQAHSQTKTITAYTFYSTQLNYTLTIVDTPGFGDTDGIKRDKYIANQIKMFFNGQDCGGIDVLHGIGFVTQSSLARLTPSQKYIFDAVLSIFGKDIVDNIFLLATFADVNTPQVLEAVKEANIPFQKCFKFNNSALFAPTNNDEAYFNSLYWEMGFQSFAHFFVHFNKAEMKSLLMTREVLKERQHLEMLIPALQVQIKVGLNKMDAIAQEEAALIKHTKSIMENKNFKYECTEQRIKEIPLASGTNTTTCRNCNFTCHDDCAYDNSRDKAMCCAMTDGSCTMCPKKCHWSHHSNVQYRIEYYSVKVMKTYEAKKALLDEAESGKERVERILAEKRKELSDLQAAVFYKIKEVQICNERLAEIALKPNPLTEIDYLELLISSEESEQREGWKVRIAQYKVLINEAQVLKTASDIDIEQKGKTLWEAFNGVMSTTITTVSTTISTAVKSVTKTIKGT